MKRLQEVLQNQEANYILPFFWQHGEAEDVLRKYMQVIHDANIGAVCVESRPHPDFVGDKWWTDMDVILDEAKRLDMKVWILDDSHFPTGYANGAIKNAPKELHHKYMSYRTLEMAGPVRQVEFNVKEYMEPAPLPPWIPAQPKPEDDFADNELVSILACPILDQEELGEPIDLTGNVEGDRIVFDLPEGYFRIFVSYITRNGKGRNDYINFMDKDSCRLLIDAVYEPHFAHYKEYFGNVIAGFFSDEPPLGNVDGYMPIGPIGAVGQDLPWSARAAAAFTEEYGSDAWKEAVPYLWAPAADKVKQAKVRNAYMEMVTKLVAECFSEQNGQWCREHGVEYIGHMLEDCDMNMAMGASMGHFFRGLSGQDMAGIDNIGGQVTIGGQNVPRHEQPACKDEAGFYQYLIGKLGASHAAIDPKKLGRCMCENFGAYGWQSGPTEQKFMMDHFMVRGVNRYVPHAFSPAPFPDPDCPPHFYAHGENPTYRAFGELMAYSNRVCHLIDGGHPCPDVAVLYAAESVWAGDGDSNIPVARSLTQSQVDFHVIPADVFAEQEAYPFAFTGGRFFVNQVEYRALVISGCTFVEEKAAGFIRKAVSKGFPVIFADHAPIGIVNASQAENDSFVKLVQNCRVIPAEQLGSYIREQKEFALQVKVNPKQRRLTTYHYQLEGRDEIFILNECAEEIYTGEITVQAQGIPVRYYPWENRMEKVDCEIIDNDNAEYESTECESFEGKTVKCGVDGCNGAETGNVDCGTVRGETVQTGSEDGEASRCVEVNDGSRKLFLTIHPLELCTIIFLKDENELAELEQKFTIHEKSVKQRKQVMEITEFMVGRIDAPQFLAGVTETKDGMHEKQAPLQGMQSEYPEYSGVYVYEAQAALHAGQDYQLEIADVYETAEVFLNGTSLGTKVQRPYRFAMPAELVKEQNQIRIEVATLLERKVKAMGAGISAMSAERPLSPTGIVGEVAIYQELK